MRIEGSRVFLRPMEEYDAESVIAWRNDPTVSAQMFSLRGPTLEEHMAWFKKYCQREDRKEFVICRGESGEPIGTIGLSAIDRFHGKAEYGIVLGEEQYRGKGYAREATQLILQYGFEVLNLQKISLRVFAENTPAIILYEHCGFVREGYLKREYRKEDRYCDVIAMAAFRNGVRYAG